MATKQFWPADARTGGGTNALDSIDGDDVSDGDVAFVVAANDEGIYIYKLDADSGASEADPNIIAPDSNAGDKRWILQAPILPMRTIADGDTTPSVAGGGIFVTANTSSTLISGFDDGVAGQPITLIIGDANTILDFSASNLKGNAGVDYTATANDVAVFVTNDGTTWYAIGPFQNG